VQMIAAGETKAMHHLQNADFSSFSNAKTRLSGFIKQARWHYAVARKKTLTHHRFSCLL